MPPQVMLRAHWDASFTLTDRTESDESVGQVRNETTYRIRWRLVLEKAEQEGKLAKSDHTHMRLRFRRAMNESDWTLFWQSRNKSDQFTETYDLIPASLRDAEVNVTGTKWNPAPGQFCK